MKIIIAGLDKYNYEENEILYCCIVPAIPKLYILHVRHRFE
jgi:hypothetical protein